MRCVTVTAACMSVLGAVSAFAAESRIRIEVVQGTVLVGNGSDFQSVMGVAEVNPQDRIVLKGKAAAILSIVELGCYLSLREPGVYVVPAVSICSQAEFKVLPSVFAVQQANGVYSPAFVPPPPPPGVLVAATSQSGAMPVFMGLGFSAAIAGTFAWSVMTSDETPELPASSY